MCASKSDTTAKGKQVATSSRPTSATRQQAEGKSGGAVRRPAPLDGYIPPNRPQRGTIGETLQVVINFFPITIPAITIHQYDVKIYNISPEEAKEKEKHPIANRYVCRSIMNALSETNLKGQYPAYDGRAILYCKNNLTQRDYIVKWIDKDDGNREREHAVELQYATRVDLSVITEITKRQSQFESKQSHDEFISEHQTATNAIDALFRQFAAVRYTPIGRGFYWYSKRPEYDLGAELELWEGYTQSVRPGHGQVYLNLNMSYRPVLKPNDLLRYLEDVLNLKNYDQLCDKFTMEAAVWQLLNLEIFSEHLKIKRKYKITKKKVFLLPAVKESFLCEGKRVTVQEYFKNQYKIVLKYPNLPCIDVGRGDKVTALPMEVCYLKQGQLFKKEMNLRQKQRMIEATSIVPNYREEDIRITARDMLPPDDPLREFYGIKTSDRMEEAQCRQLPSPNIRYQTNVIPQPKDGKWQIKNCQLINPVHVNVWAIIHFSYSDDRVRYGAFIDQMVRQAREKGIQMRKPINERDIGKYRCYMERGLGEVDDLIKYTRNNFGNDLQLIFCIIDRNLRGRGYNGYSSDDIYSRIKLVGDSTLGVVTQCIDQKNAISMNGSTLGGVCLKMNAKLGGTNHFATVDKTIPLLADTMIIGADVNHPGVSMYESPSIAVACVALDREISRYYSTCRFQVNRDESKQRQEIILEFESMCNDLLREYTRVNDKPKQILFYRDGVSESQFQFSLEKELPALERACRKLEKDYKPKITLVCVQKRHHMRMFELAKNKVYNVPPGTYLDHTITHPYEYDFYLCSHAALKGTARASHYHVLHDEIHYTPNDLYTITNQLCYCYSRCTKSVSIPPPVYYADLIAYRYCKYYNAYYRDNRDLVKGRDPLTFDWDYYRRKIDIRMEPGKLFWA